MSITSMSNRTDTMSSLEMVVLRADGTVKSDLGKVAYWHRNPIRRICWSLVGRPLANRRIYHLNKETNQ